MQHQFMQRQIMAPRPQSLLAFQQTLPRHPQHLHRHLQHPQRPRPQFQQHPHQSQHLQHITHPQHRQQPQHPHPQHPRPIQQHPRQFQQPQFVQQSMPPKPSTPVQPATTITKSSPPKPEVKKPPPTTEDSVDLFIHRPGLGKPFKIEDVILEAPETFAAAKKVHSSILDQKIVYNPTLPGDRETALNKVKEAVVNRLNSTLKLKSHWASTRPLLQSNIPIPQETKKPTTRQKRKKLSSASKRSKKKRKSKAAASSTMANAEDDASQPQPAQWVQCDNIYCRKWRKMKPGTGPLRGKWYCVMNTWNPREASCSMPEPEPDQN